MPLIGNDLATIRKHLGMSLEHIHQITKIPVVTLKRVENNSIFTDRNENETYVRSFVRSYAKAMKIELDVVIKALDQQGAGNYSGLLLQEFPELTPQSSETTGQESATLDENRETAADESKAVKSDEDESDSGDSDESEPDKTVDSGTREFIKSKSDAPNESKAEEPSATEPAKQKAPPADTTIQQKQELPKVPSAKPAGGPETIATATELTEPADQLKPASDPEVDTVQTSEKDHTNTPPTVSSVNWAEMGERFRRKDSRTPSWIIAVIVIVVLILVALFFVFQEAIFDSFGDNPESETSVLSDQSQSSATNLDFQLQNPDPGSEQEEITPVPDDPDPFVPLADTLQLTILAANDRLDPVRVWSDMKPRLNPYWMDPRTAYHFEFVDTIRIQGQFSRMQLFLNGHRIDDFRESYYNSEEEYVEITRSVLTDEKNWGETVPLELAEDTPSPTVIQFPPLF